jgi:hypothetical protein
VSQEPPSASTVMPATWPERFTDLERRKPSYIRLERDGWGAADGYAEGAKRIGTEALRQAELPNADMSNVVEGACNRDPRQRPMRGGAAAWRQEICSE